MSVYCRLYIKNGLKNNIINIVVCFDMVPSMVISKKT